MRVFRKVYSAKHYMEYLAPLSKLAKLKVLVLPSKRPMEPFSTAEGILARCASLRCLAFKGPRLYHFVKRPDGSIIEGNEISDLAF